MTFEEDYARYIDNRSNPMKSSERYDEIIALRLFLYELSELLRSSEDAVAQEARRRIEERVNTWGKDDVV